MTMSDAVVIDSNMLVALIDQRDKWHSQAEAVVVFLESRNATIIYFDCVLNSPSC
jgi:predicted nucleic acid-binding protein